MEKNILDGIQQTNGYSYQQNIWYQFPNIQGLQSTLLQYKGHKIVIQDQVQIIHD